MAYTKNKNPRKSRTRKAAKLEPLKMHRPMDAKKATSNRVHAGRSVVRQSRQSRSKETSRKVLVVARRTILAVIILAMMTVVLAAVVQSYATPENMVKREVEAIARDYYENYFYQSIIDANSVAEEKKTLDEMMGRYVTPGFAKVSLQQLLLYDSQKHAGAGRLLKEYCDADKTYIKAFPVAPFGQTDYRVEYHYSCNF